MARAIDGDAVKFDLSGLAYIAPYDFFGIAEYFMQQIRAMPTLILPGQWVSVEERPPDNPGHYLICTNVNYWHGGCLDVNQEHKYRNSGTPIGYDGTTMSALDCYYDITGDWNRVCNVHVTHWMPLPEPPKQTRPEQFTFPPTYTLPVSEYQVAGPNPDFPPLDSMEQEDDL